MTMNQQPKLGPLKEGREPVDLKLGGTVLEESEPTWTLLSRFATIGLFMIGAIGALYFARSLLLPIVAATIIGVTLSPIQKYAEQSRVPPLVSAVLLVGIFLAGLWLAVTLFAAPLMEWVAKAPELGAVLKAKLRLLDRPLATLRELQAGLSGVV
jgi:predicted PurR-regulated permease PerM